MQDLSRFVPIQPDPVLEACRNPFAENHLLTCSQVAAMTNQVNESTVETTTLEWFEDLGYESLHGPEIGPREPGQERDTFHDVLLAGQLRDAIDRLNPDIPSVAREEAFRKVTVPDRPTLIAISRHTGCFAHP